MIHLRTSRGSSRQRRLRRILSNYAAVRDSTTVNYPGLGVHPAVGWMVPSWCFMRRTFMSRV